MNKNDILPDVNRRSFLKNTSLATMMAMMGGVELRGADAPQAADSGDALTQAPPPPTVHFGVIGLGSWGREILNRLSLLPNAPVVAICDTYPSTLRRVGTADAPKAERFDDYKKLLASNAVEAVIIATPTPDHREIVLAALQAGKHVYCEAPYATTIEDSKAIARAARDAVKVVFQAGLQERSHPERYYLLPFIRSGALGQNVMARAQWHKKDSWSRSSSNPDREHALNWRLSQATSSGLMGEIGIHQIDTVTWFIKDYPTAVTGFGSNIFWPGRDVADTVQGIFEYPGAVRLVYDATLCNSFDSAYEMYYGTDAAIMVRKAKAWIFKEADSALFDWEVYARKDVFYKETGIALVANATKQTAIGTSATAGDDTQFDSLYYALQSFAFNAALIGGAVKDFIDNFGDSDTKALTESLKTLKPYPAATWREGLDATLIALKANEAVVQEKKVAIDKDLFEL